MSEADRPAGRGIGGAQRVRLALYPITCAVLLLYHRRWYSSVRSGCRIGSFTKYLASYTSRVVQSSWTDGGSCGLTSDPKTLVMYRSVRSELEHFFIFGMD